MRLQTSWPPVNVLETQGELGSLVYAMTQLSARFPLLGAPTIAVYFDLIVDFAAGYQAAKVQNFLESK